MAIARYPSFVFDCPDPGTLAAFYGALLGWQVSVDDDGGWADIRPEDQSSCICFQRVEGYQPPVWPGQERPQQLHLDVMVLDFESSEPEVLELGATKADHQPGTTFRVFLDPAGHPFCLCVS
ncbi:MAG: VOC family protein [Nocardioidaceae bacterium]